MGVISLSGASDGGAGLRVWVTVGIGTVGVAGHKVEVIKTSMAGASAGTVEQEIKISVAKKRTIFLAFIFAYEGTARRAATW